MSKFLKLIKENRPGEDKYTIDLKDFSGEVVDSFVIHGTSYPWATFDDFRKHIRDEFEKLKRDRGDEPVEDQEIQSGGGGYNVDTEVEKLASKASGGLAGLMGKAMGTKAQDAKKLTKEREAAVVSAFDVYKQDTAKLKQALQDRASA